MLRKIYSLAVLGCLAIALNAQIEPSDSTMQVVGYWSKGEKQNYSVTQNKFKLNKADTVSKETMTFNVQVTILDSTDKNYKIEWLYSNYKATGNQQSNQLLAELISLYNNMKIIILTNEMGEFQSVENWKDIQTAMSQAIDIMKKKYKSQKDLLAIFDNVMVNFQTKEGIEAYAINDIYQFYSYHGSKYKLGETLSGVTPMSTPLSDKPIDTKYELSLEELNFDDNNGVLRMIQTQDETQLADFTYAYLKKMMPKVPFKRNEMPKVSSVTELASRIHNAGWVVYSVETKNITAIDATTVEERIIELQ